MPSSSRSNSSAFFFLFRLVHSLAPLLLSLQPNCLTFSADSDSLVLLASCPDDRDGDETTDQDDDAGGGQGMFPASKQSSCVLSLSSFESLEAYWLSSCIYAR